MAYPQKYDCVIQQQFRFDTPSESKFSINTSSTHPDYYISKTGMEVINVIEAYTFDLKGVECFDAGNVIKYICRWKNKNGLEDLKKAQWYLNHLIEHVEKSEKENKNG